MPQVYTGFENLTLGELDIFADQTDNLLAQEIIKRGTTEADEVKENAEALERRVEELRSKLKATQDELKEAMRTKHIEALERSGLRAEVQRLTRQLADTPATW